MTTETKVTIKGTTSIPKELRKRAGIFPGTILIWELKDNGIFARRKPAAPNAMQKHIQLRAGALERQNFRG
jgi:AbrB family looped-hinge helix DNA binding protein